MSILIKGIEMPTTCGKCTLKSAIECENWKRVRSVVLDRHRDCPLVPVPPHGRLIDADKIEYVQSENGCLDDYAYRYDINEMPTIIPAEEVET